MHFITEKQLQDAVLQIIQLHRVLVAHFRPARTKNGGWVTPVSGDGKGFPDLVIVGPQGVLWRELKTEKGKTSPEQTRWLNALQQAGCDAGLWKPNHLRDGTIIAEIRQIAGRKGAP